MIPRVDFSNLRAHVNNTIEFGAWVDAIRDQKRMQFIVLKDKGQKVQVVNQKTDKPLDKIITELTPESTVEIKGKVVENAKVNINPYEIQLEDMKVLSKASPGIPITQESSLEHRMDWRFLDIRDPKKRLIFEIQTTAEAAMREYWGLNGFIEIHSPKLVGGATESGAELFQLEYFGKRASLAQSPQFYKQMAMAAGLDRVFEIGPVFRANPSFTSRHDTEFTSVDTEISWINSHDDVMQFEEKWLQHTIARVAEAHGRKIEQEFDRVVEVPQVPFPRVTMSDAYDLLSKDGYEVPREQKGDLDPEGERRLARTIKQKYGHDFVFVTDYPTTARPFYHMRHEDDQGITKSFDLLWNGLEVTTGAQREHRQEKLIEQMREKGVNPTDLQSYADFFKYGCPPHGGYGFGLTRMLMNLTGAPNVREVTLVYRGPNRLTP